MDVRAQVVAALLLAGGAAPAVWSDGAPDPLPALVAAAAGVSCPGGLDRAQLVADLIGIQSVESPGAVLHADGRVTWPDGSLVLGPALDGRSAAIGYVPGEYGGYDRASGPFQFIAESWADVGSGDRHDWADSSAAAARLLVDQKGWCTDRRLAIERYNGEGPAAREYAATVVERSAAVLPVVGGRVSSGPGGSARAERDGIAGRLVDGIVWRVVDGWSNLTRRMTGKGDPQTVALFGKVDAELQRLTGRPSTSSPAGPSVPAPVGGLVCPVPKPVVGDGWGVPRSWGGGHQGLDVGSVDGAGSPVVAPFAGVVVAVVDEADGGLAGSYVIVRAEGGPFAGAEVMLAHNQRNLVEVGRNVRAGEQVATLGSSGNASAADPHIHAQWYPAGSPVPAPATALETACRSIEQGGQL